MPILICSILRQSIATTTVLLIKCEQNFPRYSSRYTELINSKQGMIFVSESSNFLVLVVTVRDLDKRYQARVHGSVQIAPLV